VTHFDGRLLRELESWLRIPSVSSGEPDPVPLRAAAEWVCDRVATAGGTAVLVEGYGHPLAVGELRSNRPSAPTVLIYGHYDVQDPGPLDDWHGDPFEPEVRDDRIYARGASDDKGNFLPLLTVACELAAADELPVHVRVLVEGEEEIGGPGAGRWVADDDGEIDCAVVYDSWMVDEATPALTVGLRGIVQAHITVQTGDRDLHSGAYGGCVLSAAHVLQAMLAEVLPGPGGTLREELRVGLAGSDHDRPPDWDGLPPGEVVLGEVGARPLDADAADEYYRRTWTEASLDVNELRAGAPRTIVPAWARATLTQRLAPHQRAAEVAEAMRSVLLGVVPAGADADVRFQVADPVVFSTETPAIRLAAEATGRAVGAAPRLVRWGGTIPIVSELARKRIPVVVGGFALPADAPHAPNESFRVESLRLAEATAHELYAAFAALPRREVPA
jgi:acetylornithine deacetylase/succinyl-diaminopimelate desuccinylase-like protein